VFLQGQKKKKKKRKMVGGKERIDEAYDLIWHVYTVQVIFYLKTTTV